MTIFIDIDGTILRHTGNLQSIYLTKPENTELLPGVKEKFEQWDKAGHRIILTTGRRECMREITEAQLKYHGIFYDQLIMGLGGSTRILINDKKPDNYNQNLPSEYQVELGDTAVAYTVIRNQGIKDIPV